MINYTAFFTEIWLVMTAILVLLVDLFFEFENKNKALNGIAFLGVSLALLTLPCSGSLCCSGVCALGSLPVEAFNGSLKTDGLALFFKMTILLGTLFTLLAAFRYFDSRQIRHRAQSGALRSAR